MPGAVGNGGGVWPFIHVVDAARFTLAAPSSRGAPGLYNIVDDDPAPVSEWLPLLAEAVGAKPPHRIPIWIARFLMGDAVMFMKDIHKKAKQSFRLSLKWPSWRDGFRRGLAGPAEV